LGENYLKAIYILLKDKGTVRTVDEAEKSKRFFPDAKTQSQ
jgi:Mn-dependent DtxR family transcriptional regulator